MVDKMYLSLQSRFYVRMSYLPSHMHHALLGFGVDLQLPRLGWGFSDGLLDWVILVRLSVSPIRALLLTFVCTFRVPKV
jgi:hypothetical protein